MPLTRLPLYAIQGEWSQLYAALPMQLQKKTCIAISLKKQESLFLLSRCQKATTYLNFLLESIKTNIEDDSPARHLI